MDNLIIELETVTNWFVLGLHLGVTPSKLKLLKNKKMSVEYKRTQMLVEWINNHYKPTWSTVVRALEGINELQLAGHIAVKYGQFIYSYPHTGIITLLAPLLHTANSVSFYHLHTFIRAYREM